MGSVLGLVKNIVSAQGSRDSGGKESSYSSFCFFAGYLRALEGFGRLLPTSAFSLSDSLSDMIRTRRVIVESKCEEREFELRDANL